VKASPEAQRRLLELADADAELSRLEHRQRTLPETQERERLQARDSELRDEVAALEAEESDLERLEGVQQRRAARGTERAALADELADATTRRDAALADIAEQAGKASDQRSRVAGEVPAELLALYDRMREQHGGVGAAALRRGQCQGCHLSLNTVEMNSIRAAPPDEVLRCEECRRILVRTDESGL
jgi:predicted  nucleic acid-binding Zn-ribbon protein